MFFMASDRKRVERFLEHRHKIAWLLTVGATGGQED